jgi:hypothetical protein
MTYYYTCDSDGVYRNIHSCLSVKCEHDESDQHGCIHTYAIGSNGKLEDVDLKVKTTVINQTYPVKHEGFFYFDVNADDYKFMSPEETEKIIQKSGVGVQEKAGKVVLVYTIEYETTEYFVTKFSRANWSARVEL